MKQLLKLQPSVFSTDLYYKSLYSLSCAPIMSQTYVTRLSSDLEIMLSSETTTKGNNYCDPGSLLQFLLFSMTALHQWVPVFAAYLFYLKSQCIFPFNYFSCDVHSSAGSRVMNLSCMYVCIPILVTTFPEWLSGKEPLPHTPGAVRPSLLCLKCFCMHMSSFAGLIMRTPPPTFSDNRSDMCPRWESNPRLPACKASTLSTRPGSPLYESFTIELSPNSSLPRFRVFSVISRMLPKTTDQCQRIT